MLVEAYCNTVEQSVWVCIVACVNVKAVAAIHSPSTGIMDTHRLMARLEALAKDRGVLFAYDCEVVAVEPRDGGYLLRVREKDGGEEEIWARVLVNAAGLGAESVAAMARIDTAVAGYR